MSDLRMSGGFWGVLRRALVVFAAGAVLAACAAPATQQDFGRVGGGAPQELGRASAPESRRADPSGSFGGVGGPAELGEDSPFSDPRFVEAAHQALLNQYGVYAEPRLSAYVRSVTARIARTAGVSIEVTILDVGIVNAFAGAGDNIYVTRGLLLLLGDEAELASVIAHEIAHILSQDVERRYERAREAERLADQAARRAAERGDARSRADAIDAAAAVQGSLAQFSQEAELDADRRGAALMASAGYDAQAQIDALRRLEAWAQLLGQGPGGGWLDTHPSGPERIRTAAEVVSRLGRGGERGVERYAAAIDGLPVGDRGAGLRIRFIQVRPGDDIVDFAGGDPVVQETFRAINGLEVGERPEVGALVKVIVRR